MAYTQSDAPKTWLDIYHPEWEKNHLKWRYQRLHYDAEQLWDALDTYARQLLTYSGREIRVESVTSDRDGVNVEVFRDGVPQRLRFPSRYDNILPRLPYGEQVEAYYDRVQISSYMNVMADIINKMIGLLSIAESETVRVWQRQTADIGLKTHSSGNVVTRLMKDADGKRTDWTRKMQQVATHLLIYDKVFVLVEGLADDTDDAKIKIVTPDQVCDWKKDRKGRLEWLKIKHTLIERGGPMDPPQEVTEWMVYTKEGVTKYRKGEEGQPVQIGEQIEYEFYTDSTRSRRRLPVVEVDIEDSMPFSFGLTLADKSNKIFQRMSERDHMLRKALPDILTLDMDDDAFERAKKYMLQGGRVFQGKAQYSGVPTDRIQAATEVINDKVVEAYTAFFLPRRSSTRRTATEVELDFRSGFESLMMIVADALDSSEQSIMEIIEQIYFPNNPQVWGQVDVTRTADFAPQNSAQMLRAVKETFFSFHDLPVPESVQRRIVAKMLDHLKIDYEMEELEEGVEQQALETAQASAFDDDLNPNEPTDETDE